MLFLKASERGKIDSYMKNLKKEALQQRICQFYEVADLPQILRAQAMDGVTFTN